MKLKDIKLSSRQMLLDIGSMSKQASRLLDQGKEYNALLQAIIEIDFYYNDNVSIPSLKELSDRTGIDYNRSRKLLRLIYEDLFCLDDEYNGLGRLLIKTSGIKYINES